MSATTDDGQAGAGTRHLVTLREVDRSTVAELTESLHRMLADAPPGESFRLGCGAIEFIDSHGVAALIRFRARVHGLGRQLVLTDITPPVRRALEALGLAQRFGLR